MLTPPRPPGPHERVWSTDAHGAPVYVDRTVQPDRVEYTAYVNDQWVGTFALAPGRDHEDMPWYVRTYLRDHAATSAETSPPPRRTRARGAARRRRPSRSADRPTLTVVRGGLA